MENLTNAYCLLGCFSAKELYFKAIVLRNYYHGNWSTLLRQYQLRKRNCFDAILVELALEIFTFASSYRGSFIDKNIIVISFHSQDDG